MRIRICTLHDRLCFRTCRALNRKIILSEFIHASTYSTTAYNYFLSVRRSPLRSTLLSSWISINIYYFRSYDLMFSKNHMDLYHPSERKQYKSHHRGLNSDLGDENPLFSPIKLWCVNATFFRFC